MTDAATGLPLSETTSVEIGGVSVKYEDGIGTNAASRWSTCLVPGTYKIKFVADSYRPEWYHDQPNVTLATVITVAPPGPVIVNEALVPRGRVIAGRVTNASGVPKFGSVGIWRRTSTGWRSIDGIGNDGATGWYSFVVPGPGRYRVSAGVDHHKARFATSATHLTRAASSPSGCRPRSSTTYTSGCPTAPAPPTTSACRRASSPEPLHRSEDRNQLW